MKLQIETMTTLLLISVILLAGCSGCGEKTPPEIIDPSNQAAYGPVAANSREPVELPPFPDPSLEQTIEMFKAELKVAKGYTEMLERKQKAVDNPDLLFDPLFEVPETIFPHHSPGDIPDYFLYENRIYARTPFRILLETERGKEETGTVYYYYTKEQEERMEALPNAPPDAAVTRKKYEIMLENVDPFYAARYVCSHYRPFPPTFKVDFAARAMRAYPDSVEAMRLWAHAHEPGAAQISAYKQLLKKFPNSALGHYELAESYRSLNIDNLFNEKKEDPQLYKLAIEHWKKASQLDSRIPFYRKVIGDCYAELEQWEKALAVYQALPALFYLTGPDIYFNVAQEVVYSERTGKPFYHPFGIPDPRKKQHPAELNKETQQ